MGRLFLGVALGIAVGFGLGLVLAPSTERGARAAGASPRELAAEPRVGGAQEPGGAALSSPESPRREVALPELPEPTSLAPSVSEAAVRRALAGAKAQPAPTAGTGLLHGRVVDPDGRGVADVVVRAQGSAVEAGRAPGSVGQGAPALSLEDALTEAARRFGERRASLFETRTDGEGRFRLAELPELRYHVQAFKRDFEIESQDHRNWNAAPGTELAFLARPVVSLEVEVLLPDGSPASEATIRAARETERSSSDTFAWSRSAPSLRLPAGELELTALHGLLPDIDSDGEDAAELRSERTRVVLTPGRQPAPVELRLAGRSGIRGRVHFAADDVRGDATQVRLLALAPGQAPDPEELGEAEPSQWLHGGGEFAFLDLAPGRYAVGVTRTWNGPVAAQRIVEVGAGIERCDLEVPPIDPADYLVVRAFGPEGEPLREVTFGFRHVEESGSTSSSSGMSALARGAGVYYLPVPDGSRRAYYAGAAGGGHRFSLQVQHASFGARTVDLTAGQAEVEVRFVVPARLAVLVMGYVGSPYVGRLDVSARRVEDSTRSFGHEQPRIGPDGGAVFEALEPGSYVLSLTVRPAGSRFASGGPVATQEVTLRPGENSTRIVMPALHALVVRVPAASEGAQVRLSRVVPAGESWNRSSSQRCDAEGRVTFEDLPAGSYRITAPGEAGQGVMTVEVPTGEVVFVPER